MQSPLRFKSARLLRMKNALFPLFFVSGGAAASKTMRLADESSAMSDDYSLM